MQIIGRKSLLHSFLYRWTDQLGNVAPQRKRKQPAEVFRLRNWREYETHRQYFDALSLSLGLKSPLEWYKVSRESIEQRGAGTLLQIHYNNSLIHALQKCYPEIDFLEWQFGQVPKKFWATQSNSRRYLEWLAPKLGIVKLEDWYSVSGTRVAELGGAPLLAQSNDSLLGALRKGYPEHTWQGWRMTKAPQGFWKDDRNVKEFMDWLSIKLNMKSKEDWYLVDKATFRENGGGGLLAKNGDSIAPFIMKTYPEHDWVVWKFQRVPAKFWGSVANQRTFLEFLGKQLKYTKMEDWYRLRREDIDKHGGTSLLSHYYHGSASALVIGAFSDHPWIPWRFALVPRGFWENINNQRIFFNHVANELGLTNMEDWYSVSAKTIHDHGGGTLMTKTYKNMMSSAMQAVYPDHQWLPLGFNRVEQLSPFIRQHNPEIAQQQEYVHNDSPKDQ